MKLCFVLNEDISNLIDYIEHIRHLSHHHDVWLLCTGNQHEVELGNCKVVIIPAGKLPLLAMYSFFNQCASWLQIHGDSQWRVICKQARFCSLLPKKLPHMRCIFDLRSGSVSGFADGLKNRLLALEAARFQHHIVIASSVAEAVLGGVPPRSLDLSVGANPFTFASEHRRTSREKLSIGEDVFVLLYVGSITGRKLHEFVNGLQVDDKPYLMLIVGTGAVADVRILEQSLKRGTVPYRMAGYVPYDQLADYFAAADAGLCYVPVTAQYTDQPPTKLYEYLANGLPIVSTRTRFVSQLSEPIQNRLFFVERGCDITKLRSWSAEVGVLEPDPSFSWEALSAKLEDFLVDPHGNETDS